MRNRVSTSEAAAIGAELKNARLRSRLGIQELGSSVGVHHSQVSRSEHGDFKFVSPNVQKLCNYLGVVHPKVPEKGSADRSLRARFDALLTDIPASAGAFERLFDVLEASRTGRTKTRKG